MRYTERHAGKAVIKDNSMLPGAMEKLARIEELENIPSLICDKYCTYPNALRGPDSLAIVCERCELKGLFEILEEE